MKTVSGRYLEPVTDDAEWDKLVSSSCESSPFLKSSFLRSVNQEHSRFLLSVEGKATIGTCLFTALRSAPENTYAFCSYQGAFFPNLKRRDYSDENLRILRLKELIQILDSQGEPRHFSFHPNVNDLRAVEWFYYATGNLRLFPSIKSRYTGTIQMSEHATFEKYLGTIRKERLREYRRSLEGSYEIEMNSTDIMNFLKLYNITFERQGHKVTNLVVERVSNIISAGLKDRSGILRMLYNHNGDPVSGAYILSDETTDVYLFGANNTEFRDSYGPTRLLLESIKESFERNKTIFDFCGMNSPRRGEFKSSFNARVTPYFEMALEVRRGK
jgi:hypothetical protein